MGLNVELNPSLPDVTVENVLGICQREAESEKNQIIWYLNV